MASQSLAYNQNWLPLGLRQTNKPGLEEMPKMACQRLTCNQNKSVALTFRAERNKLGLGSCPKWLIKVLACPNL